jgi:molybdate transport system substrate-binding protein
MMSVGGVELVGPLPDALQTETIYAAGILIASRQPEAAKSLIAYLRTPAAAAVLRAKGLEPR